MGRGMRMVMGGLIRPRTFKDGFAESNGPSHLVKNFTYRRAFLGVIAGWISAFAD